MTHFEPVRTKADLDSLDFSEVLDGYRSAERGDPEPGLNRGRAFWHGWRNRMIDMHELPMDEAGIMAQTPQALGLWRSHLKTAGG